MLVFTRTKHGADKVVRSLEKAGFLAEAIHGNKSQNQRERVLADFRVGKLRTLIATDIAARGIDVDGVSHVINYDLPNIPESYVHRIGRTARAGADGIAISFCDHEEGAFLLVAPDVVFERRHVEIADQDGALRGGRPQRGNRQQRGNGGGNGRPGNNGHRPHNGGNGHQGRQVHQAGQNGHQAAPRQEATAGEPSDIGTVTFLQRSGEPRRNAGHRAPR